jgi:hypothetical protein
MPDPGNLSLADWYRKYVPAGEGQPVGSGRLRYANVKFDETINSHGVRFEKLIQPVNTDWNDYLDTVHNGRVYEISKDIGVITSCEQPGPGKNIPHADPTCIYTETHKNPVFQKAVSEYNHLIDSFTFL